MLLLLGLGNHGDEYTGTRHNVGFDVVDALAKRCGDVGEGFIPSRSKHRVGASFTHKRPLYAEILECSIGDDPIVLAKPTTFMNESGRAASALVKKYSPSLSMGDVKLVARSWQLVAIHDDLDLASGTLRLSTDGSSGGHKGIQSIIESLGTKDFLRLRLGIGPNATPDGTRIPAEDFVLKRFGKSERPRIDAAVAKACEVLEVLVREGVNAASRSLSST